MARPTGWREIFGGSELSPGPRPQADRLTRAGHSHLPPALGPGQSGARVPPDRRGDDVRLRTEPRVTAFIRRTLSHIPEWHPC